MQRNVQDYIKLTFQKLNSYLLEILRLQKSVLLIVTTMALSRAYSSAKATDITKLNIRCVTNETRPNS